MTTGTVTLRPATATDAEALAALVVQLYQSEVPDGMRGPRAGQQRLFRYLIEHELAGGICGRFLALDEAGEAVGTASLRLAGDPTLFHLPPRLLSCALSAVGPVDTLRLAATMLRGSLSVETPLRRDEGFIYSVVVAEAQRGRGVGAVMMALLEDVARQAGVHAALLRVIVNNARARAFYLRQGYQVIARPPLWVNWLGLPSDLLRKEL